MSVPRPLIGVPPFRCLHWPERSSAVPPQPGTPIPFLPFPLPLKGGERRWGHGRGPVLRVALRATRCLPLTQGYGELAESSQPWSEQPAVHENAWTWSAGSEGRRTNQNGGRVDVAH